MRACGAYSVLLITAISACGCTGKSQPEASAFTIVPAVRSAAVLPASPSMTLDLIGESAEIDALPRQRITVDDPVYKRRKTYEGPLLIEVVRRLSHGRAIPATAHLVLACLDGYRAPLTLVTAQSGGVLARRDLDARSEWVDLPGAPGTSPAPSYLVWGPSPDASSLPWPYEVSGIEIWDTDPLERAKPADDASADVRAGFALFAGKCARCHRVNGAGGALSSELNVPANVTEYWNAAALQAFIKQPSSVRAGAKMPAFDQLTPIEQRQLTAYMTAMKYRKLPVP